MRRHPIIHHRSHLVVLLALSVLVVVLAATPAAQASKAVSGILGTPKGEGAGQLNLPIGVAVNATGAGGVSPGDVYVVDSGENSGGAGNNRIEEFSAEGSFVRAWGIDVVASGPDDRGTGAFEVCRSVDICKAGLQSSAAGGLNKPVGIAIDQQNGNVYVVDANVSSVETNSRIDVYSATGSFEGAFGWDVDASSPKEELQFCTSVTACQRGSLGGGAGQLNEITTSLPTLGPNGHLYVPDGASAGGGNNRVDEFAPVLNGADEVTGVSFVGALGWNVVSSGPDQASEIQKVKVRASVGKFTLAFKSSTTEELAFNAPADEAEEIPGGPESVEKALNTLLTINSGGGSVTVTGGPGNARGSAPYTITFDGGALAHTDVAEMVATKVGLSGGSPSTSLSVETYSNGAEGLEYCVVARGDVCQAGAEGPNANENPNLRLGEFSYKSPESVAVDHSGALYAVNQSFNFLSLGPARVYKFTFPAPGEVVAKEFAPEYLTQTSGDPTAVDPVDVAVDPVNQHVLVAKQESKDAIKFYEFDSSGALLDKSPAGEPGLLTAGGSSFINNGLAVGAGGHFYYSNALGMVDVFGPPPPPSVSIGAVSDVGSGSATLHGTVTPPVPVEGTGFNTTYHFEYSLDGVAWSHFPAEDADVGDGSGSGPTNSCPMNNPPSCAVEQTVTGLVPNSHYLVRLVASTGTVAVSGTESFTTEPGAPSVSETAAEEVGETSATLTGFVNPSGEAATYHFEWGTDPGYGNRAPVEVEGSAGSGGEPVKVSAILEGLKAGTIYHFRLLATNPSGTTAGPDRDFSTLNRYGLPDARVPEQVSPNDKRPVGMVAQLLEGQITFQAASDGNSIIYPLLNGSVDATAGGNVDYVGARSQSGWVATQLTPPSLVPAVHSGFQEDSTGKVLYASADLSCEIIESFEPLTADTPPEDVAEGVQNLYRLDAGGTYTLLSAPVPLSTDAGGFHVDWASADCGHVLFETGYRLLEEAPAGSSTLYEWAEGTLRLAGVRPDENAPGGESVASDAVAALGALRSTWNSMSTDGSKVFFTATSQAGADKGRKAVFVREDGASTVDASQSQTATADTGARYAMASTDGSHVFFLASYGLATSGTSVGASDCSETGLGCDLYDYSTDTKTLTDLSADRNSADAKGAGVIGLLDASDDGSYVYFAAQGQLIPNEGKSEAQNLQGNGTYNVYLSHEGSLAYVGLIATVDTSESAVSGSDLTFKLTHWAAEATPDGKHLLFVSKANVTGYDSKGVTEVYAYSVASGETICVSCRTDGLPSEGDGNTEPIALDPTNLTLVLNRPRSISDDGRRVFFTMPDVLAAGAKRRTSNIYEWEDGRVYLLVAGEEAEPDLTRYAGASASGDDVFIVTKAKMLAQDFDNTTDVYDLRAGGGFAEPGRVTPACEPLAGGCQGEPKPQPVEPRGAASETFSGPGNPLPVVAPCRKGLVIVHGRCVSGKPVAKRKKAASKRCKKGFFRKHDKCVRKRPVSSHERAAANNGRAAQ